MRLFRARLIALKRKLDTAVFLDVYEDGFVADHHSAPEPRTPLPLSREQNKALRDGDNDARAGESSVSPLTRYDLKVREIDDVVVCPLCDRAFGDQDRNSRMVYTSCLFDDDAYETTRHDGAASDGYDASHAMLPAYAYLVL